MSDATKEPEHDDRDPVKQAALRRRFIALHRKHGITITAAGRKALENAVFEEAPGGWIRARVPVDTRRDADYQA